MLENKMRIEIVKHWDTSVRITRIESRETGRSIPDLQIRSYTADWWAELKHLDDTNLHTNMIIPWRPGQWRWLKNHSLKNGNVALILTIADYWAFIMDIDKIHGRYKDFNHIKESSDYHGYIFNAPFDLWEKKQV